MKDDLDKDPSFMDQYGGAIGAGLGAAGNLPWDKWTSGEKNG